MPEDTDHDAHILRSELQTLHASSFGWALACCRHDAREAEDVLHMAYLKVLDGRARFDGRSSFKTWLFGVIRMTAYEQRRRARTWLARIGDGLPEQTEAGDLRDDVELSERAAAVRQALQALPDRQRQVVELVFRHGLSVEEAAQAMGVGTGSARTHYARGKARLRQRLEAAGFGDA